MLGGGVGGGRIRQKGKRTHGHGQQCGDGGGGRQWIEVEAGVRGVSGNGKNNKNDRKR